jgi:CheY-like chemotaxis protein/REP element-mobilizing transposase RayT
MGERILVFTNHTEFGETLRLSLEEDGGYQVHYAQMANDAIQAARRQDFFLAILDAENIDLPIQKMVSSLRMEIPDIRIMVVPPFNDADHPSIQNISIDGFLSRPFFTPDLLDQVRKLAPLKKVREPTPKQEPSTRPKLTKDDLLRELDHFFNWMDKPLGSKAEEENPEPGKDIDLKEASKDLSNVEQKGESQRKKEHQEIFEEKTGERIHFPPDEPQAAKQRVEQKLRPDWMMEDNMEEKKKPESEDEMIEDLLAQLAAQSMPDSKEDKEEDEIFSASEKSEHQTTEIKAIEEVDGLLDQILDDMGEEAETMDFSAGESGKVTGTSAGKPKGDWQYLEPADEAQAIERLKQAVSEQNNQNASVQLDYFVQRDAVPDIILLLSEKVWAHAGMLQKNDLQEIEQILSSGHHEGENVDLARFVRLGLQNEKFLIYATTIQPGITLCEAYYAGKPLSQIRKHAIELARQLTVGIREIPEEMVEKAPPVAESPVPKEKETVPPKGMDEEFEEITLSDVIAGIEEEPVVDHVMTGDEWVYEIPKQPARVEFPEAEVQEIIPEETSSGRGLATEEGLEKMKEESLSHERYIGPKRGPKLFTNQVQPPDKSSLDAFENEQKHAMATFNKITETKDAGEPTRVFNAEEYEDYRAQKDAEDILAKLRARLKNQSPPVTKSFYLAIEAAYYQSLVGLNEIGHPIKSKVVQEPELIQEIEEVVVGLEAAPIKEEEILEEGAETPEVSANEEEQTLEKTIVEEAFAEVETAPGAETELEGEPSGEALLEEEVVPAEIEEETAEEIAGEVPSLEVEETEEGETAEFVESQETAPVSPELEADLEEEPEVEGEESTDQLEEMLQGILEDLEMAVPPEVQLEEEEEEIQPEEDESGEPVEEETVNPEDQVRILDEELDLLEPLRGKTTTRDEDLDFDIDVDTFFEDYMSEVGEPITPDEISTLSEVETTSPTIEEQPEEEEIPPEPSDEFASVEEQMEDLAGEQIESQPVEEIPSEEPGEISLEENQVEVEEAEVEEETIQPEEFLEDQAVVETDEIAIVEEEIGESQESSAEEVTAEFEESTEEEVTSEAEESLEVLDFSEMEETLPEQETTETEETSSEVQTLEAETLPHQEEFEEEEIPPTEISWIEEEPEAPEEKKADETTSEEDISQEDMRGEVTAPDQADQKGKKVDLDEDLNAVLISLNEARLEEPAPATDQEAFKPPFDLENMGDIFSEQEPAEEDKSAGEEEVIQEEGIEALSGDQEDAWETITEEEAEKQAEIETQRIIEDILTQPDEDLEDFPPAGSLEQALDDLQSWDTDKLGEKAKTEEDEFTPTIITGETARTVEETGEDSSLQAVQEDVASDRVIEEGLYPWETEVPQESEATPTPHAGLDEAVAGGYLDLMTDLEGVPILQEKDNPAYTCILVPDLHEFSLSSEITDRLVEWMPKLCHAYGWQLEKLSIQPTYMQWTVRVTPGISQGFIVRKIRLQTSIRMFDEFPELKKDSLSGNFWAKGYLVVSGSEPPPAELLDDFIQRNSRPRDNSSPQFIES